MCAHLDQTGTHLSAAEDAALPGQFATFGLAAIDAYLRVGR